MNQGTLSAHYPPDAKKPGEKSFNNSEYANFEKVVIKYKLNDMWQILLKEMNAQNINYFLS